MVTDAVVERFGSLHVSVPYIWTELRHVLEGLTPTGVNNSFDKFSLMDEATESLVCVC